MKPNHRAAKTADARVREATASGKPIADRRDLWTCTFETLQAYNAATKAPKLPATVVTSDGTTVRVTGYRPARGGAFNPQPAYYECTAPWTTETILVPVAPQAPNGGGCRVGR